MKYKIIQESNRAGKTSKACTYKNCFLQLERILFGLFISYIIFTTLLIQLYPKAISDIIMKVFNDGYQTMVFLITMMLIFQ